MLTLATVESLHGAYCLLLDDRRLGEWIDLFTQDGELANSSGTTLVHSLTAANAAETLGLRPAGTVRHQSFNTVTSRDGDRCLATADFVATTRQRGSGENEWRYTTLAIGRYYDELALIDGRWHFRSRRIELWQ